MNLNTKQQIDDLLLFCDPEALSLLQQVAKNHAISQAALEELLAWERAQQERRTAYGRAEAFDAILDNPKYWEAKS